MSDVHALEISLEQARAQVKRLEALERLVKNPDFALVIDHGYMRDEAVRLVSLLADPAAREFRDEIQQDLNAISALNQHLMLIRATGSMARESISDHLSALDEARILDGELV